MALRSRDLRLLPLVVVSAVILSCGATVPRPGPADSESSALAIALKMNEKLGPLSLETITPEIVLFIRLEEGEDLRDLTDKRILIPSSFVVDEYAYLLNMTAGTYVAVAAIYSEESEPLEVPVGSAKIGGGTVSFNLDLFGGTEVHRNYFSKDMIAETMTKVKPGCIAFMGSFEADQSFRFGEADDAQVHILRILEGGDVDRTGFWQDITSESSAHRLAASKIRRTREAEIDFCKKAKKHLAESGWIPMVDRLMVGL
jgi:hypothetical protein